LPIDRRLFLKASGLAAAGSSLFNEIVKAIGSFGPIDINCMIGPSNRIPSAHELPEQLFSDLDYYGIEAALAYHSYARFVSVETGNALIAKVSKETSRIRPCWVAFPSPAEISDAEAWVDRMRTAGVRALRIFPGHRDPNTFGLSLSEWIFGPLLRALEMRRVPLLVERPLVEWDEIATLLKTYPSLPFVLLGAHFGESRQIYEILRTSQNVFLGTSRLLLFNGLQDLVGRFGANRLLFDSGLPEFDPSMPLSLIYYSRLTDEQKGLILRGNFERLWKEAYGR